MNKEPIRKKMLEETLVFVKNAAIIPGVVRIALLGSLTTNKSDPKDIDLLVTVTDDADLIPLAALGRKLQGRMQSLSHGADIFLADPSHNYLGRTCIWRQCTPGIRMSCDALNCGARPHLHDDLHDVCLEKDLVENPPVELWPEAIIRSENLPQDIQTHLLDLL